MKHIKYCEEYIDEATKALGIEDYRVPRHVSLNLTNIVRDIALDNGDEELAKIVSNYKLSCTIIKPVDDRVDPISLYFCAHLQPIDGVFTFLDDYKFDSDYDEVLNNQQELT